MKLTGGSHVARARLSLLNGLGNEGIPNPLYQTSSEKIQPLRRAGSLKSRDHRIKSTKCNCTVKKYASVQTEEKLIPAWKYQAIGQVTISHPHRRSAIRYKWTIEFFLTPHHNTSLNYKIIVLLNYKLKHRILLFI
jgi:hypothetical protein